MPYILDLETASSAVRNLSGYDLCGRQLRMDFAENEKEGIETLKPIESGNTNPIGSTMAPPATGGNSAMPAHSGNGGQHPFAPSPFQGYPAPQGMSGSYQNSEVAIANLISSSNPQQLIELMSQMKVYAFEICETSIHNANRLSYRHILIKPELYYWPILNFLILCSRLCLCLISSIIICCRYLFTKTIESRYYLFRGYFSLQSLLRLLLCQSLNPWLP